MKGVHSSQTKSMHHITQVGASHRTKHQPLMMHEVKLEMKEQGLEQSIACMSCWLSSKLKTSRLLFCRWALLDLGSGMKPCCRLHLMSTCACTLPGISKGTHCGFACSTLYKVQSGHCTDDSCTFR